MIPLLLLLLPSLALAARPKDAIKLSDVQSLTLHGKGEMTNHRRVGAIPQLRCISRKPICDLYQIDVMRCTNQGSSWGEEDIQWSCVASLPEELKLGGTDVICEGYSSPDDPYVLKGSCGVEYTVALTSKGEKRYPDIANGGGWFNDGRGGTDWAAYIFTIIFVGILGWIIYSACIRAGRQGGNIPRHDRGGWQPGPGPGWGPGGDDNNDPPPPYPGTKPPGGGAGGWKPGFWSGAAAGAGAGYWAGGRNNRNNRSNYRNSNDYGSTGGGSWFNGGGSHGGGSSGGSFSSTTRSSTGFGSTSRR